MKRALSSLLLIAAATACHKGESDSVILVRVTTSNDVSSVTQLRADLKLGELSTSEDFPAQNGPTPLSFPASFSLTIPRFRQGTISVLVKGLNGAGTLVAMGADEAVLMPGGQITLPVTLTRLEQGDGKDAGLGSAPDVLSRNDGPTATGGMTGSGGATTDARPAVGGVGGSAVGDGPTPTGGVMVIDAAIDTRAFGSDGAVSSGGVTGLGGAIGTGGASSGRGGATGPGGTTGHGGTGSGAGGLPDIDNSPVLGEVTYSAGASWDIDGTQWPAFEIITPTARYWLIKADAAIASITDNSQVQWISFSSGFRPNRGVPNLGGCCQLGNPTKLGKPTMTTEVDPAFTVTSSHLRLVSKSEDASYWLVWDFFLTHFTVTINRAAAPFGFTYRGVPEGALGSADQLVVAGDTARSAANPYTTTLPGPSGWAYLTHPATKHSLFLIQHSDDTLSDTYRIADGDTAMFVFGNGLMEKTPARFSLGLMDSCDAQAVSRRIAFVQAAIPSL